MVKIYFKRRNRRKWQSSIEIDENKMISNNEDIYWMFGKIYRETKEERIFCVLNNWTKNNILPIIKIILLQMKKKEI